MAYGNSYSYNRGYSNSNYGRAPYNSYQNRPAQPRKKSGCTLRIMSDGSPILSGWKAGRTGMLSLYARPYKGTKKIVSKSGKEWLNLFVTITNRNTMQVQKTSGLFNKQNGKLYIKELNLIANPKAPRGGYFGKHLSRTYNR